jgi:glycosyltransferase involved in cell wall biosynthesis
MKLTAIILTYNEELHLERCIKSLMPVCQRICIIDSFSTDATVKIAKSLGAEVYQNKWENNHAKQFNWGLENCKITSTWTIRLDADEYLLPELQNEILDKLDNIKEPINGIELKRRVYFKGTWIKFGGFYPIKLIRIWRTGFGKCEHVLMDEHVEIVSGEILKLKNDFVDENLNTIFWWVTKHNYYARREAADFLKNNYSLNNDESFSKNTIIPTQAKLKRFFKLKIYNNLPKGLRPLIYIFIRFIFQLGFLDGPKGWLFHFLQGFWYRVMVDVNIYEMEKLTKKNPEIMVTKIKSDWQIDLNLLPSNNSFNGTYTNEPANQSKIAPAYVVNH